MIAVAGYEQDLLLRLQPQHRLRHLATTGSARQANVGDGMVTVPARLQASRAFDVTAHHGHKLSQLTSLARRFDAGCGVDDGMQKTRDACLLVSDRRIPRAHQTLPASVLIRMICWKLIHCNAGFARQAGDL